MPTELIVLAWSVVLLFVHIFLQSTSATRDNGLDYNASARDEDRPVSKLTGRFERARNNFLETYPAFVALALALAVSGRTGGWAAIGAVVWIVARAVYLPLYAAGVPVIRSLVYVVSVVGLALMFFGLLF
ncbi:MAG: MAPEG family protein [Methylobacterium mesophilicum]|nr:MAPEG family protein [Methylobacterium mesophilicum]